MKEKVISFGTMHPVKVIDATEQIITVHAPDINQGFLLVGHGVQHLPKKDDTGSILFVEGGPKSGHWAWFPEGHIITERSFQFISMWRNRDELHEDRPVYRVRNNKGGEQIAMIFWYKPWNKYCFTSQPQCIFDNKCLKDILSFIESTPTIS